MRLLELYACTGSVGNAFTRYSWDVIGLDITKGHAITCDILQWDYTIYKPGYFDAIHASPLAHSIPYAGHVQNPLETRNMQMHWYPKH